MGVAENRKVLEKLRRLERLAESAATPGERTAAEAARRRLVESLERRGVHVSPGLKAEVGVRRAEVRAEGAAPGRGVSGAAAGGPAARADVGPAAADGGTIEVEAEDPLAARTPLPDVPILEPLDPGARTVVSHVEEAPQQVDRKSVV